MRENPESPPANSPVTAQPERLICRALERELGGVEEMRRPPPIPDHTLLQRIGRGAYGDVWLARSTLGTLRAVKVVYLARFEDAHPYEREFHGILKYEPISRTHEGLVQVLHVGRNDELGCFYYVMELADATERATSGSGRMSSGAVAPETNSPISDYSPRTLRTDLRLRQRLSPNGAAQTAAHVATALAHLHSHGLVHRDIKPSNVIFVKGQPKLADIGLVAAAGDSRSFVGTEGFIAPEGPGTAAADIFSLGKLLYELATGRDRMEFPQLAADYANSADELEAMLELNEVITRACAPDPRQRYTSAKEMLADLALFLGGRSLREARKAERHAIWLKCFAAAACVVVACAMGVVYFSKRAELAARERERHSLRQARVEAELRARAEAAEQRAQQQLYTALLEQARATVRSGELGQRVLALAAARRALAISNSAELRREVFAALALPDMRFEKELPREPSLSPRRGDLKLERFAWSRGREAIEVRSIADHRLLAALPASTNLPASAVTWSSNGKFLSVERDHDSAGRRANLEVWNVAEAKRLFLFQDVPWGANAFHPSEQRLLIAEQRGILLLNLESGERLSTIPISGPREFHFAPDGQRIAVSRASSNGWMVAVHDLEGAQLVAAKFTNAVSHIAWHPGGNRLAACDHSGAVHLIDARTGGQTLLGRHKAVAAAVEFSPDGGHLLSGGWENELACWDLRTRRRVFTMRVGGFRVQWSSDGTHCAAITPTGVQLHRFERPTMDRELAENLGVLRVASFSTDGRWLVVPGDEQIGLWDLSDNGPGAMIKNAPERRAFFHPHTNEFFVDGLGSFRRWRFSAATNETSPPTVEALRVYQPAGFASACLVSNELAVTSRRGTRIMPSHNVESSPDREFQTASGRNAISPNGQWLGVSPPYSPFLYIYRWPGLERVAKLTNQANVSSFTFTPDSTELVIATASRQRLDFWSTATWQPTRGVPGFRAILFAPEPGTAWLTQEYSDAGLYDVRTLQPLFLLPTGMVPLALSADGKQLAVAVDNRRLQVWSLAAVREQLAAWESNSVAR